jgi:hypothetical protein
MQRPSPTLKILDNTITVNIKKSDRAKRLILRVKLGRVELVIPKRVSIKQAQSFLLKHEVWVKESLAKTGPLHIDINKIPIFGDLYTIELSNNPKQKVTLVSDILIAPNLGPDTQHKIKYFLKYLLKQKLTELTEVACNKLKVKCNKISLKDTSSKWGSCSSKGNLSFSWRLAFAPPYILEYIVAHEVSHLKEMNHSPNFWKLVEYLDPNFKIARLWLRKNGTQLHYYLKD